MKIVFLSPSGELGGAEISLLDILASLRRAEPAWSLHLIAASDGPLVRRAIAMGVRATVLAFPRPLARLGDAGIAAGNRDRLGLPDMIYKLLAASPSVVGYRARLGRSLKELAPDIVHTNGFKMHILGVWASPPGVPVIWHIHDYVGARAVASRLLRRQAGSCFAAITNSKSVAEDLRMTLGAGLKIHTVYNAVDLDSFSPAGPRLDLDRLAGLARSEDETIRVGLVATFGRWKGHTVFLKALSLLPASLNVRGYVIGGPLYQTDNSQCSLEELRGVARDLGLSDRVGFTGYVEETSSAVRALDIVAHASTEPEPFGMVIAEAMACGRAVIISEAGGASELIERGVNALGHRPGDAPGLAACIKQLALDPDLCARVGRAGRRTAERRFDRARLADELIPIYNRAAQSVVGQRLLQPDAALTR
ncbi:MAG TPA: glycosyltransferase family 4 protein [Blastocatellia bacterium]|nr:glycosyltransferase family 4 protein [Blastocatellia bacterium]